MIIKLNKDLFLFPERLSGTNTIKREDEDPFHVMSERLPKMLSSKEEKEMIDSLGDNTSTVILYMIIIPLVAGILLKGLMAKLWAMLNTFQLINELSILSINVPSNVSNVQKESLALINFNPIPKDLIYSLMFKEE